MESNWRLSTDSLVPTTQVQSPSNPLDPPYHQSRAPLKDVFLGEYGRLLDSTSSFPDESESSPIESSASEPTTLKKQFGSIVDSVKSNSCTSRPAAALQLRPLDVPTTVSRNTDAAISSRGSDSKNSISNMESHGLYASDDEKWDPFKRFRGDEDSDALFACWKSPLCPNSNPDGTPPNPVTCGGECAPYLFNDLPQYEDTTARSNGTLSLSSSPSLQRSPGSMTAVEISLEPVGDESIANLGNKDPHKSSKRKIHTDKEECRSEKSVSDIPKTQGRQPHNQVEKKYRESLNAQLEALRRVVPSLQQGNASIYDADIEDLPTPVKASKAIILASATAYIKKVEREKKELAEEVALLRKSNNALLSLVKGEDRSLMQYVANMTLLGRI